MQWLPSSQSTNLTKHSLPLERTLFLLLGTLQLSSPCQSVRFWHFQLTYSGCTPLRTGPGISSHLITVSPSDAGSHLHMPRSAFWVRSSTPDRVRAAFHCAHEAQHTLIWSLRASCSSSSAAHSPVAASARNPIPLPSLHTFNQSPPFRFYPPKSMSHLPISTVSRPHPRRPEVSLSSVFLNSQTLSSNSIYKDRVICQRRKRLKPFLWLAHGL